MTKEQNKVEPWLVPSPPLAVMEEYLAHIH